MKKIDFWGKFILVSAVAVALSGCFNNKQDAQKKEVEKTEISQEKKQFSGTVNFYTSLPKTIALEIADKYHQKHPEVTVNVYRSGASKIMAKLGAEIEAGKVMADVVWLADPGNTIFLKNKGVLLKYTPENAEKVAFKDKDGYYFAGRFIAPVIAFNTGIVKNPPKAFKVLSEKEYRNTLPSPWNTAKGWCAIPNPLYSGSALAFTYGMYKLYGWDYFKNLKNNGVVVLKSNGSVKNGIIQGENPVGVTLDYMVRQQKAKGMNIDYLYPEDGTVLIPSPVAVLKTTKNPEVSKDFENFLLSKEVQTLLADNYIIPARSDVSSDKVPSIDSIKKINVDWDKVSENLEKIRNRFSQIMLK